MTRFSTVPRSPAPKAGPPVRSVSRALSLLRSMADAERSEWSLSELCAATGLPKPTAHRLLTTMIDAGFVEQALAPGYYRLGLEAAVVGHASLELRRSEPPVHRILADVGRRLGETVAISLLSGTNTVVIARTHPRRRTRVETTRGAVLPAHVSCGGKLLLSTLAPDEVVERYRGRPRLPRYTANTITRMPDLLRHLELVRERGYAIDDEEYILGMRCMGVLIPSASGRPRYGVGLSAPTARTSLERLRIAVRLVEMAALELSAHLDDRGSAAGSR